MVLLNADPPTERLADLRHAAAGCPAQAISVEA
ncbi:ferredoxin [Streptomyces sp. NPDC002851]